MLFKLLIFSLTFVSLQAIRRIQSTYKRADYALPTYAASFVSYASLEGASSVSNAYVDTENGIVDIIPEDGKTNRFFRKFLPKIYAYLCGKETRLQECVECLLQTKSPRTNLNYTEEFLYCQFHYSMTEALDDCVKLATGDNITLYLGQDHTCTIPASENYRGQEVFRCAIASAKIHPVSQCLAAALESDGVTIDRATPYTFLKAYVCFVEAMKSQNIYRTRPIGFIRGFNAILKLLTPTCQEGSFPVTVDSRGYDQTTVSTITDGSYSNNNEYISGDNNNNNIGSYSGSSDSTYAEGSDYSQATDTSGSYSDYNNENSYSEQGNNGNSNNENSYLGSNNNGGQSNSGNINGDGSYVENSNGDGSYSNYENGDGVYNNANKYSNGYSENSQTSGGNSYGSNGKGDYTGNDYSGSNGESNNNEGVSYNGGNNYSSDSYVGKNNNNGEGNTGKGYESNGSSYGTGGNGKGSYSSGSGGSYGTGSSGSYGSGSSGSYGSGSSGSYGTGSSGSYDTGNSGQYGMGSSGSSSAGDRGSYGTGNSGVSGTDYNGSYGTGNSGTSGMSESGSYGNSNNNGGSYRYDDDTETESPDYQTTVPVPTYRRY